MTTRLSAAPAPMPPGRDPHVCEEPLLPGVSVAPVLFVCASVLQHHSDCGLQTDPPVHLASQEQPCCCSLARVP